MSPHEAIALLDLNAELLRELRSAHDILADMMSRGLIRTDPLAYHGYLIGEAILPKMAVAIAKAERR